MVDKCRYMVTENHHTLSTSNFVNHCHCHAETSPLPWSTIFNDGHGNDQSYINHVCGSTKVMVNYIHSTLVNHGRDQPFSTMVTINHGQPR